MDNRAIGIFDSGLGGLTAVKELEAILPHEDIIYFGDTGRVPYGSKSPETVIRYTRQITRFLKEKQVKAVLAACGTVSSVAGEAGRQAGLPYFDVVLPTVKAAISRTRNGKIGVIGTATTIASGSYRNAIREIDPKIEVFEQACPMFVPLVENGYIAPQDEVTRLVCERSLGALRPTEADTLILGCTHFPIIAPTISSVMGKSVTLVNSGKEAALALSQYLRQENLLSNGMKQPEHHYFVSDSPEGFSSVAAIFLGHSVRGITKRINIEEYEYAE